MRKNHLFIVFNQVADASEGTMENTGNASFEQVKESLTDSDGKLIDGADVILAAIQGGDLVAENSEVTRRIEGKPEPISRPYIRLVAKTMSGALALTGGDESKVWDKFNVGFDMGVRSTIGQQIMRENEGPEKYLKQAAKYFSKLLGVSEDAAVEHLKGLMQSGAISAETLQNAANQG